MAYALDHEDDLDLGIGVSSLLEPLGSCSLDGCRASGTQLCEVDTIVTDRRLEPIVLCSRHGFERLAAVSRCAIAA